MGIQERERRKCASFCLKWDGQVMEAIVTVLVENAKNRAMKAEGKVMRLT